MIIATDRQIFIALLLLFPLTLFFQEQALFAQSNERQIQFEANMVEVSKNIASDAKRLIGNVVFKHKGAVMNCDSAYFYSDRNALDAFGNVFINQGDSLLLYSDFAEYDGQTRMARARDRVKLIDENDDGQTVLNSEYLDFDMDGNVGFYEAGGEVLSGGNCLISRKGYYYADEDLYFFKDSVRIFTDDYIIYSDTLKYHTQSHIAFFFGPTEIVGDSNYIYCENGWYNTDNDRAQFSENAYLINDNQRLMGDSLFYDRQKAFGEAFNNVSLIDTSKDVIISGHYGIFNENSMQGYVTDSALFIQIQGEDSLFVHGDTLWSVYDSLVNDSLDIEYRVIKAFHHVKIFREDIQGKCDSLTYSSYDSIFRMFDKPVLWTENNQLTAEYIEMYSGSSHIDSVKMYESSFIISEEDSTKYSQIKGRNMIGYFRDNDLREIWVFGNGETIYYPKDDEEIIGVNKATSSNMLIRLKEEKIYKINFINQPDAVFMSLEDAGSEELILPGFDWLAPLWRPMSWRDVFIWNYDNPRSGSRKSL